MVLLMLQQMSPFVGCKNLLPDPASIISASMFTQVSLDYQFKSQPFQPFTWHHGRKLNPSSFSWPVVEGCCCTEQLSVSLCETIHVNLCAAKKRSTYLFSQPLYQIAEVFPLPVTQEVLSPLQRWPVTVRSWNFHRRRPSSSRRNNHQRKSRKVGTQAFPLLLVFVLLFFLLPCDLFYFPHYLCIQLELWSHQLCSTLSHFQHAHIEIHPFSSTSASCFQLGTKS